MTGRTGAVVAFAVLASALAVAVLVWTPWEPLPGRTVTGSALPLSGDFTSTEVARAQAYRSAVRLPSYLSLGVGLAVALALGLTPLGARLVGAGAARLGGSWWVTVTVGGLAIAGVARLVSLPFAARVESVARAYGLSTRTWGGWALDVVRGFALSTLLVLAVLLAFYALVRAFPVGWWLPAATGGAGLVLAVSFAYPLLVEPVFNDFRSLPEGTLRRDLLALAERDGLPVSDILVSDASRRTSTLNAYVSGFGASRRLVVYDTLLERGTAGEVRAIVAHELGHAANRDVLRGTLVGALGLATGTCLLYLVLQRPGLVRRAGVEHVSDPRSLALVLALFTVGSTIAGPVQLLVSRRIETRADIHALELTRDPTTAAAVQRRLAVANLSDLDPPAVIYGLFASHPTAPMRIALARDWAALAGIPVPGPLAPSSVGEADRPEPP